MVRSSLIVEGATHRVAKILSGTEARDIPIETSDTVKPIFDWRQLQRWKIDESVLPPNSEVKFREFSLWTQYGWWFVLVMAAAVLQSALVVGMIYEDRRRRNAETHERTLLAQLSQLNRVATAGELTASIAHEIRQPLAAIVVCGSAALNWLKNKTPDLAEIRTNLQTIVDEGYRAGEVIQNTRAMFRKEERRIRSSMPTKPQSRCSPWWHARSRRRTSCSRPSILKTGRSSSSARSSFSRCC